MSSPNHKAHKQEIDLYKHIAAVINKRLDLTAEQKTSLIHECFDAAKTAPNENGLVNNRMPGRSIFDSDEFKEHQARGNTLANFVRRKQEG